MDRVPPEAQLHEYHARVVLDRLRAILPVVIGGLAVAAISSEAIGVPIHPAVVALNLVCIAIALALWLAIRGDRLPHAYAHAAAALTWLLAPTTTLAAQWSNGVPWLALLLMLELTAAAIQVSTRWMVSAMLVAIGAWIPLAIRDGGPWSAFLITAVVGGAIAATVTHVLLRRSLDSAERRRRDEESALAAALASREALVAELAERRKAESDREQFREQFVHAQRLEAVGTLAAGLAHDMNNILAGILSYVELVRDDEPDPQRREDCDVIIREIQRGAELTRGLLAFSRKGQYRRQVVALRSILEPIRPLLSRTLPKSIEVEITGAGDVSIDVDPAQIGQAVMNLCLNGADAMAGAGKLAITMGRVTLSDCDAERLGLPRGQEWARLEVTDTGTGMDEATRRRVFEPFFTTKPLGKGTGLGLAMVYGAVSGHDGAIDLDTALGKGSTFRIYFPIANAAAAPPKLRTDSGKFSRRHVVLVVDDEPLVRAATSRALERMGLSVVAAENGAEALALYDRRSDEIALVVLDMAMPVMGGAECFRNLRARGHVPVLVASGYAIDSEAQDLLAAGSADFLDKPFTAAELSRRVERLIAKVPSPLSGASERFPTVY
jgi:signal transduction histidine kinase/CheY-like chemotaxis protein